MPLPALEPFTPTGVGSLPFTDVAEAVDAVLGHAPDFPYAPQLPQRTPFERMVPQTAEGLPGIKIEPERGWPLVEGISIPGTGAVPPVGDAVVSDQAYPGLYALLERLQGSGKPVAVHLAGPVTVASNTTDGRGRRAIYDPGWRRAAAEGIGGKGAHIARLVRDAGCEPVIVLDEPWFWRFPGAEAALTPNGAQALVADALERIDAPRGIHCCAQAHWDLLFGLPVDLVMFDAYTHGEEAMATPHPAAFVGQGGAIAWGIVPTTGAANDETAPGLVGRLRYHQGGLERAGIDPERAAAASLVTPSCGLGTLPANLAGRVLELLGQVSAGVRSAG